MKKVAITGNYGVGKSFVTNFLEKMGYKIFDSDKAVKKLYENEKIRTELVQKVDKLEKFDIKKLTELTFFDDESRKQIENYVHNKVKEEIQKFTEKNKEEEILFYEIPLLFEANMQEMFDKTICIYCSEPVRRRRASARQNYDPDIFNRIEELQMDQNMKQKLADYVINSDQEEVLLKKLINQLIERIRND